MNVNEMKSLVSKIMRINRLHRSVISDGAGELKLQRSGHMILLYIMNRDVPPSQKDIAESFGITPAAVAMTLKKMEKRGLIERRQSELDSRVNIIRLSEAGEALIESNKKRFEELDRAMLCGIPHEELEAASQTLDKMIKNLIEAGAKDEPCITRKRR